MDRIGRNATTVPTPVIDVIDDETLQFFYQESTLSVGGFDWSLQVPTDSLDTGDLLTSKPME